MQVLESILKRLEGFYGKPDPPAVTDPFQMILLENCAYLVDDAKRESTFLALGRKIGLTAKAIQDAPAKKLKEVAALGGIIRELRVKKLRKCAEIVMNGCDGDLLSCLRGPIEKDRKVLKRFPGIGDPAADRILLFSRRYAVFTMDSNVLRALLRIGFGSEQKDYSASYRSVMQAIQPLLPKNYEGLIRAYLLLRMHGQATCKNNNPRCGACPVYSQCGWPDRG